MLENGRKTIGVFVFRIVNHFQQALCHGIEQRCRELGYNAIIFSGFGNYARDDAFAKGEEVYSELPDYERLNGAIIAPDTFDMPDLLEETIRRLKAECKGPVVSIRTEGEVDYNILVDNKHCMDELFQHLIEHHGYRDICFMTGRKGMVDAEERLEAYFRIMKEYNLPVDESMYLYGDFWKSKAAEACDYLIDKRGKLPEAICCANDYMGISLCHELSSRGYRVPEDIAVCGFDGVWETKISAPPLTTATVDFEKMGKIAVDAIAGKVKERTIWFPAKAEFRISCGCESKSRNEELKSRNEFYYVYENERQNNMVATFHAMAVEAVNNRDEIAQVIRRYLFLIDACEGFYICLQDHMLERKDSVPYGEPLTENMLLPVSVDLNVEEEVQKVRRFSRKCLLPNECIGNRPEVLYVVPLHYKERNLGYAVAKMSENNQGGYPAIYQSFIVSISNAIQDLFNRVKINQMIDSLEELSIHDSMTGVYNRYGFEEEGRNLFEKGKWEGNKVFFLSIDLDGLKKINDNFGHAAGDHAICATTACLKKANNINAVIARMGGDEFNVVGTCSSEAEVKEFIRVFEEGLAEEDAKHEYNIQASVGKFIWEPGSDTSWEECLLISDNRMYTVKRSTR